MMTFYTSFVKCKAGQCPIPKKIDRQSFINCRIEKTIVREIAASSINNKILTDY
ncbi:MAG: hypothetical protein ACI9S8_000569 [Chlamydiales bacterium]|jgi:hypothetical protein